jgi:hypothetical protein
MDPALLLKIVILIVIIGGIIFFFKGVMAKDDSFNPHANARMSLVGGKRKSSIWFLLGILLLGVMNNS